MNNLRDYLGGFTLCSLLVLVACGGSKTKNLAPAPDEIVAPEWFLSPPTDPNYIYAAASQVSRDQQISIQKAEVQARGNIAQQMELKISNLTKQFQEEVGVGEDSELLQEFTSVTKAVTQQTLGGSKRDQAKLMKEKNGMYRAYVLMSLPIGKANKQLMEKIKANQNLFTRFRSTEAFEELDNEIEKLNSQ